MSICLNMIVKNERHVIEKCLNSIRNLINYWVIHDTGSTDGTQEVIQKCLENIPGELRQSEWKDFEHNRNLALNDAKQKADYLLLIDADEVWRYSENFHIPLTADVYYIRVKQLGAGEIKRKAIVRASLNWSWVGKIHENLQCDGEALLATEVLKGVKNICNESKGARANNVRTRLDDATIAALEFQRDPTNGRSAYYAGVSYLSANQPEIALKYFGKCINSSKISEEVYQAVYHIGICQMLLNKTDEAITTFLNAHTLRPTRAEPLYRAAIGFRGQNKALMGYLLTKYALKIPFPEHDFCIEDDIYSYLILVEFANCAIILGRMDEAMEAKKDLLENKDIPDEVRDKIKHAMDLERMKTFWTNKNLLLNK